MNLIEWVFVGILQGIFEWLPVSSQGVISLVLTQFFGQSPTEAVNSAVFLHSGTMLAALLYFSDEYREILSQIPSALENWIKEPTEIYTGKNSLLEFLLISTFLTGLVGGPIYLFLINRIPDDPSLFSGVVGISLLLTGLIQYVSGSEKRDEEDLEFQDSALVGLLQGLAIIPGISRSGSTVFGFLVKDFDSSSAFRLSFIMSVPAILISQIVLGISNNFSLSKGAVLSGLTALIVGYISIEVIIDLAEKIRVSYVCFVLAALSFAFMLI